MREKREIDRQREAAFSLEVGGDDDKSGIKEVISTSYRLYTLTEQAVYSVQLADDIDPERTNPNIPNLSQKVISAGYGDEIVGKVLMTAMMLFHENNSQTSQLHDDLFEVTVELTKHNIELRSMVASLAEEISSEEEKFCSGKQKVKSFYIPSITDLETKLHGIVVKLDKTKDCIMKLYQIHFLPGCSERPQFDKYRQALKDIPEMKGDFLSAWDEKVKFLKFVREARNCSEHPRAGHQLLIKNFQIQPDGSVNPPLIEVEHKDTPFGLLTVIEFIEFLRNTVLSYSELSYVLIKSIKLLESNPLNERVSEMPEEARRHPFVRFYRTLNFDGVERILG